ncbi:MAG: M23 family metallopeptidase [Clostridiales bacterium]|nr:M23 family metallopeptidase [Clostridiales bacterium]
MKKIIIAALMLTSLLFAFGAYAEDNVALPGARADAAAAVVQSTPAAAEENTAPEAEEVSIEAPAAEEAPAELIAADETAAGLEITKEYRWFISQSNHIRGRTVRYYDDVYCYNHGDYYLTPFDSKLAPEYLTVDASGTYAVAPIVLDITDAMRVALYGDDLGEVSMFYAQYCERRGNGHGQTGFTGVHEGVDFTNAPGAPLYAILGGEVTRAGDSNGTVAVYNEEYDVTVLYLHCEEIEVRRGDVIEAGACIGAEGKKGSGGTYTHVEMRTGRHTTSNPYRNTILESDCPYPVMQAALGVVESGRQPVTAAAVMEAQRMREEAEAAAKAEAEAAAKAAEAEAEPEIELIDVLDTTEEGYGFAEQTVAPEATLPPSTK